MQFVPNMKRLWGANPRAYPVILSLLLLAAIGLGACGGPASDAPVVGERAAAVIVESVAEAESAAATETDAKAEVDAEAEDEKDGTALQPPSGMPTIALAELPPEALETIILIASDGPFPYDKDGTTFFNREGILPAMPEGYYREYTVETPGSRDRGARRIVGGEAGELYYTDDHYDSFSWIVIE